MEKGKNEEVINKLFLIGNGFDLALGLKTSYRDFMFWLLKKYIKKAIESGTKVLYEGDRFNTSSKSVYGYFKSDCFEIIIGLKNNTSAIDELEDLSKFIDSQIKNGIELKSISSDNSLIKSLFDKFLKDKKNWVDIEQEYFDLLKKITNSYKSYVVVDNRNQKPIYLAQIKNLNKELDFINDELKEYLATINYEKIKNESEWHSNLFFKGIFSKKEDNENYNNGILYFLNFNYTDSLKRLTKTPYFQGVDFFINQIHGKVNTEIIFGYGDEMDKFFSEIEQFNENEFLKHIKSFSYLKYPNYSELLGFLSSDKFQVCIYGHSCGLSDRVMLNEIFEHDNCHSIRIFYYKDREDYVQKTMNISRHFNSNKLMRQRIINFDESDMIPQID